MLTSSSPPTHPPPNSSPRMETQLLCASEQRICVFPTHFSSLEVRNLLSKLPLLLERRREPTFLESPFCARHSISCFPTGQLAWWASCSYRKGRCAVLALPVLISRALFFPDPEFFSHINMDKVLLWTVHSSRNDRCQIKLQNSPTLHSLHSPPINKRILVLLSRKTLLIMALLGIAGELLLPALQSLHYFAHTLLTPDVKQYSVFKCDYLNSSRNIWGISGWPPVLSWTSRATEMGYYRYLRIATAFLLAGINYGVTPPWYPACCEPFTFKTKWGWNHKYLPHRNTWGLFFSLLSNTAKSRLWSLLVLTALFLCPRLLCHWAAESPCSPSLSTIHSSVTA